jgi:hypothetical protein
MSEDFNMSLRKLLKQIGVTSQQAIEEALRTAGPEKTAGKTFKATMVLRIVELDLEHKIEGEITDRADQF